MEQIKRKTIGEIKAEINLLNDNLNSLNQQKKELQETLVKNHNEFKTWLTENFKNFDHGTDYVYVKDKKFRYEYSLDNDILRMKKKSRNSRGFHGFHPMDMFYDQMMEKMESEEEIFYEGNKAPKELELYETLKNDILNNGEISTRIKKYIGEDRIMRQKLNSDIDKLSDDIYNVERSINNITYNYFKEEFNEEKIKKLFAEKTTFVNGEYTLKNKYKSVTFKKETLRQYQIDMINEKDKTFVDKINKNNFDIRNYICIGI